MSEPIRETQTEMQVKMNTMLQFTLWVYLGRWDSHKGVLIIQGTLENKYITICSSFYFLCCNFCGCCLEWNGTTVDI